MRIPEAAIEAVLLKVNRAQHHFVVLKEAIERWNQKKPYRFIPDDDPNGMKYVLRVHFLEPIPAQWSVILGEAIYDLRSSLDQAIYWLSVDHAGKEVASTQFPVFKRRADFFLRSRITERNDSGWAPNSGMFRVREVGPGPLAFVQALQPYPQRRTPYCRAIRELNDLCNQDKHRLVHLWGLILTQTDLRASGPFAGDCVPWVATRIVHENAVAFRLTCPTPRPGMKMGGECIANVAIQGAAGHKGGPASLWNIYKYSANVTDKLVRAIGRQEGPIDLTTWDALAIPT